MSIENGRWAPGIGDPTIIGWVTVAAYFIVAIICFRAFLRHQNDIEKNKMFWLFLAIALFFLGVNKQLDIQSLFTQIGKDLAVSQGWYAYRRFVQASFIIAITILGIISLIIMINKFYDSSASIKIAILGCVILISFVLIRASSFHNMDIFINTRIIGIRMNSFIELGGLVTIAIGGTKLTKYIEKR